MKEPSSPSLRDRNRQQARDRVLDAAERLLSVPGTVNFSMRELASEAGVSFATPFNHFGSKGAVLQALSTRVIGRMADRFDGTRPPGDAADRVLAMGEIAAGLLLERPTAYRAVVASLGAEVPSEARAHSRDLWSIALGDMDGLDVRAVRLPLRTVSEQLAAMFRGCLSFWIAGEIEDGALGAAVARGLTAVLLGFAVPSRRDELAAIFRNDPAVGG